MFKTKRTRKPAPRRSHVRIPGDKWTECYKLIVKRKTMWFDVKRHIYVDELAEVEADATCRACRQRFLGRVPESIIRRRQYRGLVYYVKHHPHGYGGRVFTGARRIVGPANGIKRERGICCWCFRPTETKQATWHRYCYAQWMMAAGNSVHNFKEYLPDHQCAVCGLEDFNLELDHKVAIGIAERTDHREHIRAFAWGNLQWLCREHHKEKTAEDVRRIAEMKRAEKEREAGLVRML